MIYCDNCGEAKKVLVMRRRFPFNTASTNAGEDATICRKCMRTMLEEKQMQLLNFLSHDISTTPNTTTTNE